MTSYQISSETRDSLILSFLDISQGNTNEPLSALLCFSFLSLRTLKIYELNVRVLSKRK